MYCPYGAIHFFAFLRENNDMKFILVQRESNPCRISVALFGAFGLVVLDLRRQACVLRVQNPSNIPHRNVPCSFFGADLRSGEALTAGNTLRIAKGNNKAWA